MTLALGGRKVVVTGEERDVVIWIREWQGDVNELKQLLARIEAQVASEPPNETSPHSSLWRETMRPQKSYW